MAAPTSVAELKRYLQVGTHLYLSWARRPDLHPELGDQLTVVRVQRGQVGFDYGRTDGVLAWLHWRPERFFTFDEHGFTMFIENNRDRDNLNRLVRYEYADRMCPEEQA